MPSNICDSIDAKVKNFIWHEKPLGTRGWNLGRWDSIARPKCLGGLGVRRVRFNNLALLGKFIWDILSKPYKHWVQLLTSKYLGPSSVFDYSPYVGDSYTWKSIMKVVAALKDGFKYCVGRGQISFRYDRWLDGVLCEMVPYVNIRDIDMIVLDAGHWFFANLATILPNEMCAKITYSLIVPHSDLDDVMCWVATNSGICTAKMAILGYFNTIFPYY